MQSGDTGRSGEICKGEIKEMRSLHNRMRKKIAHLPQTDALDIRHFCLIVRTCIV